MAEFHSSYCFDVHLQKKICEVRPMLVDGNTGWDCYLVRSCLASILLIVEVAAVVLLGLGGGGAFVGLVCCVRSQIQGDVLA